MTLDEFRSIDLLIELVTFRGLVLALIKLELISGAGVVQGPRSIS